MNEATVYPEICSDGIERWMYRVGNSPWPVMEAGYFDTAALAVADAKLYARNVTIRRPDRRPRLVVAA